MVGTCQWLATVSTRAARCSNQATIFRACHSAPPPPVLRGALQESSRRHHFHEWCVAFRYVATTNSVPAAFHRSQSYSATARPTKARRRTVVAKEVLRVGLRKGSPRHPFYELRLAFVTSPRRIQFQLDFTELKATEQAQVNEGSKNDSATTHCREFSQACQVSCENSGPLTELRAR